MANIYPQDDTYGKKSTNRWQESIAKNDWTAHERSKDWPHPLDSDEREESVEDISGSLNPI